MDKAIIEGRIYSIGTQSEILFQQGSNPFYETIKPGAFKNSILTYGKVPVYFNHNRCIVSSLDDVELHEDDTGLIFTVLTDDIETISKCIYGKVRGASFKFVSFEERIKYGAITDERTVEALALKEISILDKDPAYSSCVSIKLLSDSLKIKAFQYYAESLKYL